MNVLPIDSSLLGAVRFQNTLAAGHGVADLARISRIQAAALASARTVIAPLFADAGVEAA